MYHFQWVVSDLHDSLPWLAGSHVIHTLLSQNLVFFHQENLNNLGFIQIQTYSILWHKMWAYCSRTGIEGGECGIFPVLDWPFAQHTGTEHIMYLALVKYKQYLTRGIEHNVERIFTSLHFHDSFLIYLLLKSPLNKGHSLFYGWMVIECELPLTRYISPPSNLFPSYPFLRGRRGFCGGR